MTLPRYSLAPQVTWTSNKEILVQTYRGENHFFFLEEVGLVPGWKNVSHVDRVFEIVIYLERTDGTRTIATAVVCDGKLLPRSTGFSEAERLGVGKTRLSLDDEIRADKSVALVHVRREKEEEES